MLACRNVSRFLTTSSGAVTKAVHHVPVMADLVIEHLNLSEDKTIIDMTFGAGGHTKKMLEVSPEIKIVALDRDPVAHQAAQQLASHHPLNVFPVLGKFSEMPKLLDNIGIQRGSVDGMLFDFGCSSMQMDDATRGFSISKDGPLDMRMNCSPSNNEPTAAETLAHIEEDDLARTIKVYGEEKLAKKIARAIVEARYQNIYMRTSKDLSTLVADVCGFDHRLDKMQRHAHVATKVFQALRILVNNELNEINYGMLLAQHYLKKGGRLVTLTFHSLEDKVVKRHLLGNVTEFVANAVAPRFEDTEAPPSTCWKQLHKHVMVPPEEEVWVNPRSRSAKMRVAEKVACEL